jgi:hypothetical protein
MKTTYHGEFALPSSARISITDLLRPYAAHWIDRLRTEHPVFPAAVATAGRRGMQRLLGVLVLLALLSSTSVVAGEERTALKRPVTSNAWVHRISSERTTSGRRAKMDAVSSDTSFRAEDIVPDICKRC